MANNNLPFAAVKRTAEEGGCGRVGKDATFLLIAAAEVWIKKTAIAAQKYAEHTGRKTLKAEDVQVVLKEQGIDVTTPPTPKPKPVQVKAKPGRKPKTTA